MATREFLINNINKDTIYGVALQESCWDYELKCLNEKQYKKMEIALQSQCNWLFNDILIQSYSKGNEDNFGAVRNKLNRISTLVDQIEECNPLMLSSYACVLKIMILQHTMKYRTRVKNYINLMEFMSKDLIGFHAIEANIATNYFLGVSKMQEIGDKIFKFGKRTPVLLNAWNTCWDIFYLRFLQMAYFDDNIDINKPKLVTSDKGIINLARMTSLEAVINDDKGVIPILSFHDSDIKEEFIDIVKHFEKKMYFDTIERKKRREKIEDIVKYAKDIVISLEEELLYLYKQT
jgi:hypothetical protein